MLEEQLQLEIDDAYSKSNYYPDEEDFRNYVIHQLFKNWLTRYAEQKFIASTFREQKITSTISDVPSAPSNQFKSMTEMAAIKSADAKRFIEIFHEKLRSLPKDYQRIIERKYLQIGSDGKWIPDELVYPEINIARTTYFELKPKSLYLLGWALLEIEC